MLGGRAVCRVSVLRSYFRNWSATLVWEVAEADATVRFDNYLGQDQFGFIQVTNGKVSA